MTTRKSQRKKTRTQRYQKSYRSKARRGRRTRKGGMLRNDSVFNAINDDSPIFVTNSADVIISDIWNKIKTLYNAKQIPIQQIKQNFREWRQSIEMMSDFTKRGDIKSDPRYALIQNILNTTYAKPEIRTLYTFPDWSPPNSNIKQYAESLETDFFVENNIEEWLR